MSIISIYRLQSISNWNVCVCVFYFNSSLIKLHEKNNKDKTIENTIENTI